MYLFDLPDELLGCILSKLTARQVHRLKAVTARAADPIRRFLEMRLHLLVLRGGVVNVHERCVACRSPIVWERGVRRMCPQCLYYYALV